MENKEVLEYKNFYLFYKNLYQRLFDLIDLLIEHNSFNCLKIKNTLIDFLDSYSYYLMRKKEITKDEATKKELELLKDFKDFEEFYSQINNFPSFEYQKVRIDFKKYDNNLKKLSDTNYKILMREYYNFFDEVLLILNKFIGVTSEAGFLPNIKSKKALRVIGYANYDFFFTKLEELKIKVSEITTKITLTNSFKSRRALYVMVVIFKPYFSNLEVYNKLQSELNFNFLDNEKIVKNIRKANNYNSSFEIPLSLMNELEGQILKDLKQNISFIKRYISYEFGEKDISPKIKRKYSFVPYGIV